MEVFTFENEDHTLGTLLQEELLLDPDVTFSGYIAPHPLEKVIKLKVQVKEVFDEDSGEKIPTKIPKEALLEAIERLKDKFDDINQMFTNQ